MGPMIANRYRVLDSLGSGAGGEVYRVQDTHEGDEVALKILDPATLTPYGPWAEAQILRRLTDHHILPIRNAFVQGGRPILVTELALKGTVEKILAGQPLGLDPIEAVRWVRQACQGVARGHDLGLVHNDIKPGNLFLTHNDDCRVGDFGFAGAIHPVTSQAPVFGGSFETMAPEVAAAWSGGSPLATTASDVYSLGATAFWMLTGRPPHDLSGLSKDDARALHVSQTPAPKVRDVAPHVPDAIARVVDRALSKDSADRPPTAHQLGALFGRALDGRYWRRTDEHGGSGHLACWRGTAPGSGADYLLCMTQGARSAQRVLTATHANSGSKIARGCDVATQATWPRVVRRLLRALG